MNLLPHLLRDTGENPQHCIIWLHGLGADGYDFLPMVTEINLSVPMRYIFPHAPEMPVTINGGYIMPAWYDIKQMDIGRQPDEQGIRTSQSAIEAMIEAQIASGIPSQNIFLAGFSQGGAIVLQTGLRYNKPLGGILALSTYLPLVDSAAQEKNATVPPIFMAHGRVDTVVPLSLGSQSCEVLQKLGCNVTWKEYNMAHSVCEAEIRDVERWLVGLV